MSPAVKRNRPREHPKVDFTVWMQDLPDPPRGGCTYWDGYEGTGDCRDPWVAEWYERRTAEGETHWVRVGRFCPSHDDRAAVRNVGRDVRWMRHVPD